MEDFVWVLMAGLVLFLLAGALSIPFPQLGGPSGERKNITLYSEDLGALGKIQKSYRDISIGQASVGTTKGESVVKEYEQVDVSHGLLNKNFVRVNFRANSPQTAILNLEVDQTNLYGKLWVEVNGERIFSAKAGDNTQPEIELQGLHAGNNEVTIGVTPSPTKFWGASLYRLSNVRLKLIDYQHQDFSQSFTVNEYETKGFDSGKLSFKVSEALRKDLLSITINGYEIYTKKPMQRPLPYTIDFYANNTGLRVGENQLTIETKQGSYYLLDNLGLRIYYYGNPEQKTMVRQFELDDKAYKRLAKDNYQGLISFNARVQLRGDLTVGLPLQDYTIKPSPGDNRLYFDSADVKQGSNQLQLRTSGRFDLEEFKIRVVPTHK